MDCTIGSLAAFVTVLCTFSSSPCIADDSGAFLQPKDPVKRAGDNVLFNCRSPQGYTGMNYPDIRFVVKHNDVQMIVKTLPDSSTDTYSTISFYIANISQANAGSYSCEIIANGKNVTVTSQLFVIEGDSRSSVVQKDTPFTMDCLSESDSKLPLVVKWFVNELIVGSQGARIYSKDTSFIVTRAQIDDAYDDISCVVTSRAALDVYAGIAGVLDEGSVTKLHKAVTVLDVKPCSDMTSCVLEAQVHGSISDTVYWQIDGVTVNSTTEVIGNITTCMTNEQDINSTQTVELLISDGQDVWKRNITIDSLEPVGPIERSTSILPALAGVLGGIAIIIVVVLLVYCIKRMQANTDMDRTDLTKLEYVEKSRWVPAKSLNDNGEAKDTAKPLNDNGEVRDTAQPMKDDGEVRDTEKSLIMKNPKN